MKATCRAIALALVLAPAASFATKVPIPIEGATLNVSNFLDALKARRAFATEDKTAQVVLTGNGMVMGQTISNSGALTLAANYASSSGGTAQRVQFFEGVPGLTVR